MRAFYRDREEMIDTNKCGTCGPCTLCMRSAIGKGKEYKVMANSTSEPATALETLGTILAATESNRDAIHLAVVPVTSDERLFPNQHVGLVAGSHDKVSSIIGVTEKFIGIVDPFL